MDQDKAHLHSYLFTVRIWLEEISEGQVRWHGKAQAILNGETCYFRDWMVLLTFINKNLPKNNGDIEPDPDREDPSP